MGKRGKGSSYERELCKLLSSWWTDGKRSDVFWRTGGSGGRAKVRGRGGYGTYGQHGDIAATDPIGDALINLLCIEIKRGYSSFSVADILYQPLQRGSKPPAAQKMDSFLEQTRESWKQSGSFAWLLIHRRDQRQPVVFMPDFFWKLAKSRILDSTETYLVLYDQGERIFGVMLKDFLEAISPRFIKALAERV